MVGWLEGWMDVWINGTNKRMKTEGGVSCILNQNLWTVQCEASTFFVCCFFFFLFLLLVFWLAGCLYSIFTQDVSMGVFQRNFAHNLTFNTSVSYSMFDQFMFALYVVNSMVFISFVLVHFLFCSFVLFISSRSFLTQFLINVG